MIADTMDWLEWRSGERNEGVPFASLTFVSKLMGALATLAFGLVIAAVGYSKGVPVTLAIREGVWMSITLVPALGCLADVLPFAFYPLTERKLAGLAPELLARRLARTPAGKPGA
jgi:Na+/melibiose symporter-like transporter